MDDKNDDIGVEKEENEVRDGQPAEEKEESDLDDIDEESDQYRSSMSDAGSARQSVNEGPGPGGLSLEVKSLPKGQPINHFQMLNLLRKIMLATTTKSDKFSKGNPGPLVDPTHAEEDGKSESDDDDEEDEEDDDDDDVFEPSTPKPEEAEAVGNDAPET